MKTSRRRENPLWFILLTAAASAAGCGDSSADGSRVDAPRPNTPVEGRAGADGKVCPEPSGLLPETGPESVVGNGTSESCTEDVLRQQLGAGGRVRFNCGPALHTITLSRPYYVAQDVTIDGGGRIALSGGKRVRIFDGGSVGVTLRLANITLRDGLSESDGAAGVHLGWNRNIVAVNTTFVNNVNTVLNTERTGGAVALHSGRGTFVNCVFRDNSGRMGAGINNLLSDLTVINSTFINNTPPAAITNQSVGGGIYIDGGYVLQISDERRGKITICGSRFENNTGAQGGALFYCGYGEDRATISRSSFIGNHAPGGQGGGIWNGCNAQLDITASTLAGNDGARYGGAIWSDSKLDKLLTITSSTLVDNHAQGTDALGGAIWADSKQRIRLRDVTIARNSAEGYGGGPAGGLIDAKNTIIAYNTAGNRYNIKHACGTQFVSSSNNIQFPNRVGNLNDPNNTLCHPDIVIADPALEDLAENGGPTQTVATRAGSPAVDKGEGCELTDQRGQSRVRACDIGAFEQQ